jgi:23S rRNA pseudouridine1911/1915/1917 synthase
MPAERFVGEPGRLDTVLTRLAGLSRADVQRAIASGRVTVDGTVRPKSFALLGGEALGIEIDDEGPLRSEGPPVPVRFEDEHLLVIAKPPGLITHPTERRRSGTLVNRLLGMDVPLSSVGGPLRPGIVHRLDAGTSGLMVVAKTDEAHEALAAMFRRHDVDRRYLALVRGSVAHGAFAVDAALGRHAARVVLDATGDGRPRRGSRSRTARLPHLLEAAPAPDARTRYVSICPRSAIPCGDRVYGGRETTRAARPHAAVPPFMADRVHAPDHGRTGRARGTAPGRSCIGAREGAIDEPLTGAASRPAALTAPGGGRTLRLPRNHTDVSLSTARPPVCG